MIVETEEIIKRHFPLHAQRTSTWSRLYPYAYTCYDECPFRFFCKYIYKHKVEKPHIMVVGTRCHAMTDLYYGKVKVSALSRMLSNGKNEKDIHDYILKHFARAIHDEDELATMHGFSTLEARRLLSIKDLVGTDERNVARLYLPAKKEIKLNSGNFGGKLDAIFRCEDGLYMPLDWKDGLSVPKVVKGQFQLYDSYKTQMHIYGILIDDLSVKDEFYDEIHVIKSAKYAMAFPRHVLVAVQPFEPFIKKTIRDNVVDLLDGINDHFFPMQVGEFTCGFGKGSYLPCECFDPICKRILVKDCGFEITPDGSVSAGIEG